MNYEDIAKLIPKKYRKEILEKNMIANAQGHFSDNNTTYLHTVWQHFVEPEIGTCSVCLQRVLDNFRKMQQTLVDVARKESLLDNA